MASDFWMIPFSPSEVQEAIEVAMRTGATFVDLFAEYRRTKSISFKNSNVERVQNGREIGVGIRVVFGNKVSYAYTDDLSVESLISIAKAASAMGSDFGLNKYISFRVQPVKLEGNIIPPETIETEQKIAVLAEIDRGARSVSTAIRQVEIQSMEASQEVLIANSEGLFTRDRRVRIRLMVQAVAERHGELQTGIETPGECRGFEFYSQINPEEIGRAAAIRAMRMLEAVPAPSGSMPVVIDEACFKNGIPMMLAGGMEVDPIFLPGKTGCFNCLEDELRKQVSFYDDLINQYQKEPADWVPAMGTVSALVGSYVAYEAIKHLSGYARPATYGRMLRINPFTLNSKLVDIPQKENCPVCSKVYRREGTISS